MFEEFCELFFKLIVLPVLVLLMLLVVAMAWPTIVEQATTDKGGWDSGARPEGLY
ncbi:MAG: hypothetical protein IKW19_09320 [Akkermansia sp.]|nr:hypothetical protein [Akkermansia sp.]MBR5186483.1 hypothetical protein [Akkermansia sp.]